MEWPDNTKLEAYYEFYMDPVAASRPRIRVVGRGKATKTMAYYVGKYQEFKTKIAPGIISSCVDMYFDKGIPLITWQEFLTQKPRTSKLDYPNPDIDNYLKALFDVLNGNLWYDDKQIVETHARKDWATDVPMIRFGIAIDKK